MHDPWGDNRNLIDRFPEKRYITVTKRSKLDNKF